eukprot:scaffold230722_cov22-Prasinocladus_malaysianus.AAC.1
MSKQSMANNRVLDSGSILNPNGVDAAYAVLTDDCIMLENMMIICCMYGLVSDENLRMGYGSKSIVE